MHPSRRHQYTATTGRAASQTSRHYGRSTPDGVPVYQEKDILKLRADIRGTDFKAGQIVHIEKKMNLPMMRSPPSADKIVGTQESIEPDPSMIFYGFHRKDIVADTMYYRSRNSGINGAPHNQDISTVPNGPPPVQELPPGTRVYLKKDIEVFDRLGNRGAHKLVAPAGTRCFVAETVTRKDNKSAYARAGRTGAPADWYFYVVQAKVNCYREVKVSCTQSTLVNNLEELTSSESKRYNARQPPPPAVVAVQQADIYQTPRNFVTQG